MIKVIKMLNRREITDIKKRFPVGTVVVLDYMDDYQAPIKGTKGTVYNVDDIGQIHVHWENGSTLALNTEVDLFHIIPQQD